ncbi:hypothetical protein GQ600_10464 [Phytophthora cactorum]|nr:hypothetical protein GQ600_10464 [Phytophthora cactorum]
MNPSMMATRNALPLSNPATLMYIREKTAAATDTETTTSTADVAFLKSRDSTGARLSRKMEKLFSSRKVERRQNAADLPAKKSAFYRHDCYDDFAGDMDSRFNFSSLRSILLHIWQRQRMMVTPKWERPEASHFAIYTASQQQPPSLQPPSLQSPTTTMNAHTRFALPVNTHANLKLLHDKAQANTDDTTGKTDNQVAEVTVTKQQRRDSKLSLKMKMLFPGKKTKAEPASEEDEAMVNERKRSTMAQLVGSHAFAQMGRR